MKFTTSILAILSIVTVAVSASAIPTVPDVDAIDDVHKAGCSAGAKCHPWGMKTCAKKQNGQKVLLECNAGCWYIIPGAIC